MLLIAWTVKPIADLMLFGTAVFLNLFHAELQALCHTIPFNFSDKLQKCVLTTWYKLCIVCIVY